MSTRDESENAMLDEQLRANLAKIVAETTRLLDEQIADAPRRAAELARMRADSEELHAETMRISRRDRQMFAIAMGFVIASGIIACSLLVVMVVRTLHT